MKRKPKAPKKSSLEAVAESFQKTAEALSEACAAIRNDMNECRNVTTAAMNRATSSACRAEDAQKRAEEMLSRASSEVGKLEGHIQAISSLLSGENFQNVSALASAVLECRASAQVCRDIRREIESTRGAAPDGNGGRFGIDDDESLDV